MSLRAFFAKQSPLEREIASSGRFAHPPRNDMFLVFDVRSPYLRIMNGYLFYNTTDTARQALTAQPVIRLHDSRSKEVNMSEQEKSEFEKELLKLMRKHNVKMYFNKDYFTVDSQGNKVAGTPTWFFIDDWRGKVYFPISNLPLMDTRDEY